MGDRSMRKRSSALIVSENGHWTADGKGKETICEEEYRTDYEDEEIRAIKSDSVGATETAGKKI